MTTLEQTIKLKLDYLLLVNNITLWAFTYTTDARTTHIVLPNYFKLIWLEHWYSKTPVNNFTSGAILNDYQRLQKTYNTFITAKGYTFSYKDVLEHTRYNINPCAEIYV